MGEYYIKSLLPDWLRLEGPPESCEVKVLPPVNFQIEWARKLSKMWDELTDSEREGITPIEHPYTEKMVIEFVTLLKKTKEQRGVLNSIISVLPDLTRDKEFPHSEEWNLIHRLESKNHPVWLSWMSVIESGTFMMGALEEDDNAYTNEKPRHEVTLNRRFAIGKYTVIQSLWQLVMGHNPSNFKGSSRPVETVSWLDCVEFCNKLSEKEGLEKAYTVNEWKVHCNFDSEGYRLPTEAEWEYSARGGEYHLYAGCNFIDRVAWNRFNSGWKTHPVGQKKANGFGLYDMSGNVKEWCWDRYGSYHSVPETVPTEASIGSERVIRGGDFRSVDSPRISYRYGSDPSNRHDTAGFRICRTIR